MERLVVALVLVAVAVVVAVVLERRKPAPPTQPKRYEVPTQLDRDDFDARDKPWLVAVFTSATCDSCAKVLPKAAVLASSDVGVVDVPYPSRKDLHQRYAIDVVPTLVVADREGVVRASFIGQATATDLWAAVAEAREPGSSPEPGLGHVHPDPD
ncbi:MAG TPA: thioredoxin domain-containing protein [Acidimicrobiales bacterium]|nr:thioredoxin domain-containing protein [Acidimicrobiales bacterium]